MFRRAIDSELREVTHILTLAGAGDHDARLATSSALGRAFNDMQERLAASRSSTHAALEFQAMHDVLTGLPNRMLLMDRLSQAIRSAQRDHHGFAFMLADLDHFKEVNDTLGHPCGDAVLREAAGRMRAVVRDSDTVARLGGDEFAFLLPTASDEQAAHCRQGDGRIRISFRNRGQQYCAGTQHRHRAVSVTAMMPSR